MSADPSREDEPFEDWLARFREKAEALLLSVVEAGRARADGPVDAPEEGFADGG